MGKKASTLSETLKAEIQNSGKSIYQLAKETGLTIPIISRFISDERDIRLATADKIAAILKLELKRQK